MNLEQTKGIHTQESMLRSHNFGADYGLDVSYTHDQSDAYEEGRNSA
jgi:hypothetical protein